MGKGGYNGGSTIIKAWPSKTAKLSETEFLTNNKKYLCKICQKEFSGDRYFDHLRGHGIEGCLSCGEPYHPNNPNELQEKDMCIWRICSKCAKKDLVSEKRIDTSLSNKCKVVRKIDITDNYREGIEIQTGRASEQHIETTKANKNTKELIYRTVTSLPPYIRDRRKHRNKFKGYFGDILQEAINKKRTILNNG